MQQSLITIKIFPEDPDTRRQKDRGSHAPAVRPHDENRENGMKINIESKRKVERNGEAFNLNTGEGRSKFSQDNRT